MGVTVLSDKDRLDDGHIGDDNGDGGDMMS